LFWGWGRSETFLSVRIRGDWIAPTRGHQLYRHGNEVPFETSLSSGHCRESAFLFPSHGEARPFSPVGSVPAILPSPPYLSPGGRRDLPPRRTIPPFVNVFTPVPKIRARPVLAGVFNIVVLKITARSPPPDFSLLFTFFFCARVYAVFFLHQGVSGRAFFVTTLLESFTVPLLLLTLALNDSIFSP